MASLYYKDKPVNGILDYQNATPSTDGLMSKEDKAKLNEISQGYITADDIPTSLPASNTTNSYSSTGTNPVSGKAVAAALATLDGTVSGTPSASKTLTAFSETDGKVSATFGNISITKSQVSDFPTNVSAFTNDANYLTEHQSLAGYAKSSEIPTNLSQLTGDSTHRVVTDAEKTAWNAKSTFSGDYNDLVNKPHIPEGAVIDATFSDTSPNAVQNKVVYAALKEKANASSLSTVATSGSYNDLSDKPTIPTTVSALTNDSNFITKAVNDLTNYYKKSETYTKGEVDGLIGAIPKFAIEVVNVLPVSNISTTTVYLVRQGDETQNLYIEYIYVNNAWEKLGEQKVDLTGYAKSEDIPTALSQLTSDATHRLVTDTEKSTWNSKGTYSKPSGGIPKSDLASDVQTSLGKANTALQEHQSLANYALKSEIPTIPNVSIGAATGSGSVITGISANGHVVTPAKNNLSDIINTDLSTGSSTPQDGDYYISQYVGGGSTTTSYHRRPMSALWTYIKSKIDAAGYKTTDNNTTYTFAKTETGFSVTPSGGTTQNVEVGGGTKIKITRWTE